MSDTIAMNQMSGVERLHGWWGLSYASYLTVPRTVLQSLPDELQNRLAAILEDIDGFLYERDFSWPGKGVTVEVRLRTNGRFIPDDLADYERGRRRIFVLTQGQRDKK